MNPITEQASSNDLATVRRPSCCFIVTGFGPFCGVPDNPTSVLIRRIREDDSILKSSNIHETHILQTSAGFVREKIDDIYERLKTSQTNINKGDGAIATEAKVDGSVDASINNEAIVGDSIANEAKKVIVLHLGVNYRGKHFQIEQCAFNDATFRVPDERGYQPHRECIFEGDESACHELGKCFNTTLDVQNLCQEMQTYNETIVSKDPGRFVCNYTYCVSLDRCHSANMCNNGEEDMFHSLFIHVPPFEVVSEDRQLDFILKIMQSIEQQVSGSK